MKERVGIGQRRKYLRDDGLETEMVSFSPDPSLLHAEAWPRRS